MKTSRTSISISLFLTMSFLLSSCCL